MRMVSVYIYLLSSWRVFPEKVASNLQATKGTKGVLDAAPSLQLKHAFFSPPSSDQLPAVFLICGPETSSETHV